MRRSIALVALMGLLVATPVMAGTGPAPLRQSVQLQSGELQAGELQAGELPGSFQQLAHKRLMKRGMNAAPALYRHFAYVGSRTDGTHPNAGVFVYNFRNPDKPFRTHIIGPPHQGNEGETSRELRVWPEKDLLIVMNLGSNCSELIHACSPRSVEDNFRFYDLSGKNAAKPKFIAEYKTSVNPHEFYLWDDPKRPGRALLFMSTPGGASQLLVTDISRARDGKFTELLTWSPLYNGGNLHSLSISPDGRRGYLAHLQGGVGVIDTSDFADAVAKPTIRHITPPSNAPTWEGPGAHSSVPIFGSHHMLVTDEVYGEALRALGGHGCPWGWTRIVDIADPVTPKVVADYRLLPYNQESFCDTDPPRPSSSYSAHNPTLTEHLAFISWHSGGLQVISLDDPAKPTQVADWRPKPNSFVVTEDPALSAGQDKVVVWSYPIIKDGLIHLVDIRNGYFILRYRGPHAAEVSAIDFLEGNSNLGDALRLGRL